MYPLYVTTSTATATPSRSHFQAPFPMQRRAFNVTAPPTITNILTSSNNLEAASEFNLFFSVMNPDSACSLKINTQATVCINEQIATCGNDGKYKLQACPSDQKCQAVPLDAGQTGLSIQCVPNDGANIAQLTSRSAATTTSSSVIKNGTSIGRGSGSIKITTTKIAAPSLSGNKLNNLTKITLHTSIVKSSHAPSTAFYLPATVPTPTTSSAEINSTSEPPMLRIIPVTTGKNAPQ